MLLVHNALPYNGRSTENGECKSGKNLNEAFSAMEQNMVLHVLIMDFNTSRIKFITYF